MDQTPGGLAPVVLNDAFVSVVNLRVGSVLRFVRSPSDVLVRGEVLIALIEMTPIKIGPNDPCLRGNRNRPAESCQRQLRKRGTSFQRSCLGSTRR